jgi:hypothetical protein
MIRVLWPLRRENNAAEWRVRSQWPSSLREAISSRCQAMYSIPMTDLDYILLGGEDCCNGRERAPILGTLLRRKSQNPRLMALSRQIASLLRSKYGVPDWFSRSQAPQLLGLPEVQSINSTDQNALRQPPPAP